MAGDEDSNISANSKGGRARAEALAPDERKEIAIQAAEARWGAVVIATHVGDIQVGDSLLSCAVLEDGRRVINQSTMLSALGRNPQKSRRTRGADKTSLRAPFLLANNLQKYISPRMTELLEPVTYRRVGQSVKSIGYSAELLPMVCEAYLQAREKGDLVSSQNDSAYAAEVLVRGLARVGIVALVDEATGYQETRARHELQRILEAYVTVELRPWVQRFPDEFFQEMYRLHGWGYKPGTSKRTPFAGKLVNRYIYDQLPPGVHDEIRRKNPKNESGNRSHKHHQFLTASTGITALDRQISSVITLMRVSDSKQQFEELFERAYPPLQPKLPLFVQVPEME